MGMENECTFNQFRECDCTHCYSLFAEDGNCDNWEWFEMLTSKYDISIPQGFMWMGTGYVRRPLVLIRGRSISREQAVQVVATEEPLFVRRYAGSRKGYSFDIQRYRGALKNILYRQGYDWLDTWIYSDGTIGGNLIHLGKYPEPYEAVAQYMHLPLMHPFLDMVISYTNYDENTCYWCDIINEYEHGFLECPEYDKYRQVYDRLHYRKNLTTFEKIYIRNWGISHVALDAYTNITITMWIHNGRMDILIGDEAKEKFKEYNELYCSEEYSGMFTSELYHRGETCILDKGFIDECFEYARIPKHALGTYVERGYLLPLNEDEIVVTKNWVIEQYNKLMN